MRFPTTIDECRTLTEYREFILRETQGDVANRARKKQAWISEVERGHMPKPKSWGPLLKGYQLDKDEYGERHFVRMIENARAAHALTQPNDLPLWQFARGEGSRTDLRSIDAKAVPA